MASSRRTYDTDVITLRTVFAKNPGNSNIPALRTLTADGAGGTFWAVPSTLGVNPSFNQIITSGGTYTADLSYNTFRLTAGENIGMTNGPPGSNQTYVYAKAFSQFDVSGENSVYAFLNNQLDSSVTFAGQGGIQLHADPATNTLFIVGASSNAYTLSTGIYGFNQIKVIDAASTITSSIQGWNGNFLTATSPSTLLNLIGVNDIQMSTNVTTNSVFFTISTFTSKGYLDISANAYGAYPSTLSTVSSLYVQIPVFNSTVAYLSSYNGFAFSSVTSSINALAMSTGYEFYILTGLINARATIIQLNTEISNVNTNIQSTSIGLGTLGYISTGAGGTIGSQQLVSTVEGLGSAGYISTAGGGSGDVTKANLVSTVQGLGSIGYVSSLSTITTSSIFNTGAISTYSLEVFGPATFTNSGSTILRGPIYMAGPTYVAGSITGAPNTFVNSSNLTSTVAGLGASRYISTPQLQSTLAGLGTAGYLSALRGFTISSGNVTASSITLLDVYTNAANYLTVSSGSLLVNGAKISGGGGGGGDVAQIVAGSGISVTPAGGTGVVTIAATGATTNYVDTAISSFSTALGPVTGGGGSGNYNFSTVSSVYGSTFVTNLLLASTMTTANILPSQSNLWVAVGYGSSATNSIQTSTDGRSWTDVTTGGFSSAGKGVAYNGSLWVAVGNNGGATGSIQYSGDGKNWSNASSGGFSSGGNGVAWNGSTWIAVGNNGGSATTSIQISTDGKNWSAISSGGFSTRGESIAWNGYVWVAVGQGSGALQTIQTSVDGRNWSNALSGGFATSGKGIAWNGSLWVAAGDDTTRPASLQYSGDGRNWSNAASGGFLSAAWKVAWNGKLWVAVGDESSALKSIQTSLDGSNWSDIQSGGFSAGNDGYGIAWNGSLWVATGIGASATNSLQRSSDGLNWTSASSGGFTSGAVGVGFSSNLAPGYAQLGLTILSQNIPIFNTSTNQIFAQPSSLVVNNTLTVDGYYKRVGVNCNTPAYTVDVAGTGHFLTLSTLAIQISSINGTAYNDAGSITSTVGGLGNAGYVSTLTLVSTTRGLQTSGFLSTSALISTTYGLQTSGFLSTSALVSTTYGLQTSGFLSTSALVSTTYGLQTSGFLSTPALISTTKGVDSNLLSSMAGTVLGFPSSVSTNYGSNFSMVGSQVPVAQSYTSGTSYYTATTTSITIRGFGAGGASGGSSSGGAGAYIKATFAVNVGDSIRVDIGQGGQFGNTPNGGQKTVVYNTTQNTLLAVIGGGGGGGRRYGTDTGGNGGAATADGIGETGGGDAYVNGGGGATNSSYGSGGYSAYNSGSDGNGPYNGSSGGDGGSGAYTGFGTPGDGGSGYYGGGGGGAGNFMGDEGGIFAGGGGGSSYVDAGATSITYGNPSGATVASAASSDPYYSGSVSVGGTASGAGGNGKVVVIESVNYDMFNIMTPVIDINITSAGRTYMNVASGNRLASATLDVGGLGRFETVSTMALSISSINGSAPGGGASLAVSTGTLYASSMSFVNVAPTTTGLTVLAGSPSVYTSPDGVTWSLSYSSAYNSAAIAFNGSEWVLAGQGGTGNSLQKSSDTVNWTQGVSGTFNQSGNAVMWANGMWIAGGINSPTDTNTLKYSSDGLNWANASGGFTNVCLGLAYNGKMYIAMGDGGVTMKYSYNGTSWSNITNNPIDSYGQAIAWNGYMWVAGGQGSPTGKYSYDGLNWSNCSGTFTTGFYDVAWNGSYWVGVGQDSTATNSIKYSLDGINWIDITSGGFTTAGYGISWNGSYWIAGGSGGSGIKYSSDGRVWEDAGGTVPTDGTRSVYSYGKGAYAQKNLTIRPEGYLIPNLFPSTNQIYALQSSIVLNTALNVDAAWKRVGINNGNPQTDLDVGGSGRFLTVSTMALNISSINGSIYSAGGGGGGSSGPIPYLSAFTTSTGQLLASSINYLNVGFSTPQMWVAVGSDNVTLMKYSYDGTNWIGGTNGFTNNGYCVAYNGILWVAGGSDTTSNNSIKYSYNGITWSNSSGSGFWDGSSYGMCRGVAWNGQIWVAVGTDSTQNNTIKYSGDGINWSNSSGTGFTNTGTGVGYGVAWNGRMWVAVGSDSTSNATIKYSYNGRTWSNTSGSGFAGGSGTCIAWNGRMWVAGGSDTTTPGNTKYSYDGIVWYNNNNGNLVGLGAIAWNGRMWVCGGTGASGVQKLNYSYDGLSWTAATNSFTGTTSESGNQIAWNGRIWVAVGKGGNTAGSPSIKYSSDGITWTNAASGFFNINPGPGGFGYGVAFSCNFTPSYRQESFEILSQNIPIFHRSTNQILVQPSSLLINNTLSVYTFSSVVGINCNVPTYTLDVNGVINAFTSVKSNGTNLTSDRRIKQFITSADIDICYSNVKNLPLRRFEFIDSFKATKFDGKQVGFIADEVEQFYPKAVNIFPTTTGGFSTLKHLNYDQIFFANFGATKRLMDMVESQDSTIHGQALTIQTLSGQFTSVFSTLNGLQGR